MVRAELGGSQSQLICHRFSLSSLRSGTIRALLGPADLLIENVSWGWNWGGKLVYYSFLDGPTLDLLLWGPALGSKTRQFVPSSSFAIGKGCLQVLRI